MRDLYSQFINPLPMPYRNNAAKNHGGLLPPFSTENVSLPRDLILTTVGSTRFCNTGVGTSLANEGGYLRFKDTSAPGNPFTLFDVDAWHKNRPLGLGPNLAYSKRAWSLGGLVPYMTGTGWANPNGQWYGCENTRYFGCRDGSGITAFGIIHKFMIEIAHVDDLSTILARGYVTIRTV